MEDSQIARGR